MNSESRIRIYQLLPRLFGNTNETRKPNGTLAENGVGKFADLHAALASLREMSFTHVWFTGVLRQATGTDYSAIGFPADDPALLKGIAGSPFAIKDCFDVCPDYALDPRARLGEFSALLERVHAAGMRAIIDFVPNHVARSYRSTVRPDLDFGVRDDRAKFFDPRNNFFWLQQHRATGNNVVSWPPGLHDWYETAKLNYGYDFTTGAREYAPIPDTWWKMDAVLAHWQQLGVDGFRCDMAHMVPPEFWAWAIARARERSGVFFLGEAYDDDPMKVGSGSAMRALADAGFDALYDAPSHKILKGIYDGPKWANDLDAAENPLLFERALRYAETHDEVRLAGAGQWGGVGMNVGRAAAGILFGLSRGPVLLYSGQEVGEPAAGAEGWGGDDARTTIFDYWSMPELAKWVNAYAFDGGRLSPEQRDLRAFYARLLRLIGEPAFRDGGFFGLNTANNANPAFGRLPGEPASGHWLYSFLRRDEASGQSVLVVVNLHRGETFLDVRVHLPAQAMARLGIRPGQTRRLVERLGAAPAASGGELLAAESCVSVAAIPPLTPLYFEIFHRSGADSSS